MHALHGWCGAMALALAAPLLGCSGVEAGQTAVDERAILEPLLQNELDGMTDPIRPFVSRTGAGLRIRFEEPRAAAPRFAAIFEEMRGFVGQGIDTDLTVALDDEDGARVPVTARLVLGGAARDASDAPSLHVEEARASTLLLVQGGEGAPGRPGADVDVIVRGPGIGFAVVAGRGGSGLSEPGVDEAGRGGAVSIGSGDTTPVNLSGVAVGGAGGDGDRAPTPGLGSARQAFNSVAVGGNGGPGGNGGAGNPGGKGGDGGIGGPAAITQSCAGQAITTVGGSGGKGGNGGSGGFSGAGGTGGNGGRGGQASTQCVPSGASICQATAVAGEGGPGGEGGSSDKGPGGPGGNGGIAGFATAEGCCGTATTAFTGMGGVGGTGGRGCPGGVGGNGGAAGIAAASTMGGVSISSVAATATAAGPGGNGGAGSSQATCNGGNGGNGGNKGTTIASSLCPGSAIFTSISSGAAGGSGGLGSNGGKNGSPGSPGT
jgi:hypothetical protein